MRKIFVLTIICVIAIFWMNFLVKNFIVDSVDDIQKTSEEIIEKDKNEKKSEIDVRSKISLLRGRYAIKGLIQKWDVYLENNQLPLALKNYKRALSQNPKDSKLIKKIWNTYYEMKNFSPAYSYYKKLIWTKFITPWRLTNSYINTLKIKNNQNINFEPFQTQISKFGLSTDDTFFYNTSLECLINFEKCQKDFEKYIAQGKWNKNEHITNIKKAFKNYKDLQIKHKYFKDTFFMSALFKSELYSISNLLSLKILEKKPDYLPVIKMLSKWYFELGQYENAKKQLLHFNTIDKKDNKVHYMLGIINIKLWNYILSNINFIKALKLGYKDRATISRRLIYNYYLVEDSKRMMSEFKTLLKYTKQINQTDYSLAIYYALINQENLYAKIWVNKAIKLYPKNDNFYWYKWWIYKETSDLSSAEEYLKKGLKINPHNPLINLNLGIVESEKQNFLKAKIYFKNTIKEDPNWDFGIAAGQELIKLEEKQRAFESELENTF